LPSIDNSILADGSNEYGYFGENVIFGSIEVTGGWDFYNSPKMLHRRALWGKKTPPMLIVPSEGADVYH
jgi:hypothetical protein